MQNKLMGIVLMVLVMACGTSNKNEVKKTEIKSSDKAANVHPGQLVYQRHCMVCHQRDAGGMPGVYPPLVNNKTVSGDDKKLIGILLNGMSGEIKVNGEVYNGVMASYRNLSDDEIASVLNYVRANFENTGSEILGADVKALR